MNHSCRDRAETRAFKIVENKSPLTFEPAELGDTADSARNANSTPINHTCLPATTPAPCM